MDIDMWYQRTSITSAKIMRYLVDLKESFILVQNKVFKVDVLGLRFKLFVAMVRTESTAVKALLPIVTFGCC